MNNICKVLPKTIVLHYKKLNKRKSNIINQFNKYQFFDYSFYDVYDNSGLCVNEGEPFYDLPSWQQIYELYYLPSILEAKKNHHRDLKWAIKND